MKLRTDSPTTFCKDFLIRELKSYREDRIWGSYWPVMERMIQRANELEVVFNEIIGRYGYSDTIEGSRPENTYIWLILEHIWGSTDYCRQDIAQARKDFKELTSLQREITDLADQLAMKIRRQDSLYETSGFSRADYQSVLDMIDRACEQNYLYKGHLAKPLQSLAAQLDSKYWPTRAKVVEAISEFERNQPMPHHYEISQLVIEGRATDIKDFVLIFDQKFQEINGLPSDFEFSNNALADIINVVLDLPVDRLTSGDAVRNVRHKYGIHKPSAA